MRHLASQAGLVLRNAALAAELRATIDQLHASRRRLIEAQDAERRRIERNLHDGAQQQLIALSIQLGPASTACGHSGPSSFPRVSTGETLGSPRTTQRLLA